MTFQKADIRSKEIPVTSMFLNFVKAWRTLLVYTAKNLTSFGSYELIKTQIASILIWQEVKVYKQLSAEFFFLAVRPK